MYLYSLDNAISTSEIMSLKDSPSALAEWVAAWRARHGSKRLLIIVDQFEELVTMCRDDEERRRFQQLILEALNAHSATLRVVVTVRSDFEPQFATSGLQPYWQNARFVVPPMTQDGLRQTIEGPASVRVVYFEPSDLVDRLINEVVQSPGALPLLSFTLSEMYVKYLERRGDNRALTEADYKAVGGVIGSLRTRASQEYDVLDPEHQATMQRLMLRMVSLEGGELARRRVPRSELAYGDELENKRMDEVVRRLSQARLVVEGMEEGTGPFVEPAHDELIRAWDKLWRWMHKGREAQLLQRRITQAANDWHTNQSKPDFLWDDDPRLEQAEAIRKRDRLAFNRVENDFVTRSASRKRRNARILWSIVTAGLIAVVIVALVLIRNANQIRRGALESLSQSLLIQGRDFLTSSRHDLGLLLLLEAHRISQEVDLSIKEETKVALFNGLLQNPSAVRILVGDQAVIRSLQLLDESKLLSVSESGTLLWNLAHNNPPRVLDPDSKTLGVWTTPDHGRVRVRLKGSDLVFTTATGSWPLLEWNDDPDRTQSLIRFSSEGQFLAVASPSVGVVVWDVSEAPSRLVLNPSSFSSVNALALSFDNRLAIATQDTVYVYNLTPEAKPSLATPPLEELGVTSLAFSDDGKLLAIGRSDGSIGLWESSGGSTRQLGNHGDLVTVLAFSPDGRTLASGGADLRLQLRDASSGKLLGQRIAVPQGYEIGTLAFTSNGHHLVAGRRLATPIQNQAADNGWHLLAALTWRWGGSVAALLAEIAPEEAEDSIAVWSVVRTDLERRACEAAGRSLTPEEWGLYLRIGSYHDTCDKSTQAP